MDCPKFYFRYPPFESDKADIERMVQEGMSDSDIADHYNVTRDIIWYRRKVWGLPNGKELNKNQVSNDIIEYWKNGYTPQEIADALGLSIYQIYRKMRKYGVRNVPQFGINVPAIPLNELRQNVSDDNADDTFLVTLNRIPKWVLVPVEEYQDLVSGVFDKLRNEE